MASVYLSREITSTGQLDKITCNTQQRALQTIRASARTLAVLLSSNTNFEQVLKQDLVSALVTTCGTLLLTTPGFNPITTKALSQLTAAMALRLPLHLTSRFLPVCIS